MQPRHLAAAASAAALVLAAAEAHAQSADCVMINGNSGADALLPPGVTFNGSAALDPGEWYTLRVDFAAPDPGNYFSLELEENGAAPAEFSQAVSGPALLTYQVTASPQDSVISTAGSTSTAVLRGSCQFAAATITDVAADSGPAAGGTTVTITGDNLGQVTGVFFGGVAATSYSLDSNTQLTAVSPAGAGTVDVTVTAANGDSVASAGADDDFTYVVAPPVIPTLTEWAMIVLGSVLAGAGGLMALRRRQMI